MVLLESWPYVCPPSVQDPLVHAEHTSSVDQVFHSRGKVQSTWYPRLLGSSQGFGLGVSSYPSSTLFCSGLQPDLLVVAPCCLCRQICRSVGEFFFLHLFGKFDNFRYYLRSQY